MLLRPFVIDAFLLDDSVQRMSDAMLEPRYQFLKDVSILSWCNVAIPNWPPKEWTTFDRQASTGEKVEKIKELHKVVREFRLFRDGLVDVQEILRSLDVAQTEYSKSISSASPKLDTESVKESFSLLTSKLTWMIRALTSLEDRASRKIGLQYNIENQEDNQTNLKIAKLTTDIAVYTQKDSSSMITLVVIFYFSHFNTDSVRQDGCSDDVLPSRNLCFCTLTCPFIWTSPNYPPGTLQHGLFQLGSNYEQSDIYKSSLDFRSHHDTTDRRHIYHLDLVEETAVESDRGWNGN